MSFFGVAEAQEQTEIDLRPGFAAVITLERPAGTAIVGNPDVADVTFQPGNMKIVVTGKKSGSTNVILLDAEDKELLNAEINVSGDPTGSTKGAVHVQPTVNRNDLHNYQAYYCPPGGGLCQRVNDPNSNLTQLQTSQPSNASNLLPPVSGAPLGAPGAPGPLGAPGGPGAPPGLAQ
jgi:hypothetical protein